MKAAPVQNPTHQSWSTSASEHPTNKQVKHSSPTKRKVIGLAALVLLGVAAYKAFSPSLKERIYGEEKTITFNRDLFQPAQGESQALIHKLFSTSCHISFCNQKGEITPCIEKASRITLKNLWELSAPQQQELIKAFHLKANIENIEKMSKLPEKTGFLQQLAENHPETLAKATLYELIVCYHFPEFQHVLMSDEDFQQQTIGSLKISFFDPTISEVLCLSDVLAISKRLNNINKTSIADTDLPADLSKLTVAQFGSLTGEQISKLAPQLPTHVFSLVSDTQFQKLDLTTLSTKQKLALIHPKAARIGSFSVEQFTLIFNKLPAYVLKHYVTDEQLKGLDFARLQPEQIRALFKNSNEVPLFDVIRDKNSTRVPLLSDQQLKIALPYLKDNLLAYQITDQQLKNLDWENIEGAKITQLLERHEKIALLSDSQLKVVLPHVYDPWLLRGLTNEQLKNLDWAAVEPKKILFLLDRQEKIDLLSDNQLKIVLHHLPTSQLIRNITHTQFANLDFTKLPPGSIRLLFMPSVGLGKLTAAQLELAIPHLPGWPKYWITEEQLDKLRK